MAEQPLSEWLCQCCGNLNGRDMTAIPWNCLRCGLPHGTRAYPAFDLKLGRVVYGPISPPSPAETPTPAAWRVVDQADYVWRYEEFEQDAIAECDKINAASVAKTFRVEPLYASPVGSPRAAQPATTGLEFQRDENPDVRLEASTPSPTTPSAPEPTLAEKVLALSDSSRDRFFDALSEAGMCRDCHRIVDGRCYCTRDD